MKTASMTLVLVLTIAVFSAVSANAQATPGWQNTPAGQEANVSVEGTPTVKAGNTSVVVTWDTNRRSSTIVKYGPHAKGMDKLAEHSWGEQHHSVEIQNLQPNTLYDYQVLSVGGRIMAQGQFTTTAGEPK